MANDNHTSGDLQMRRFWISITLIVVVGVLLRVFWLGRWSLWTDELYTWRIVQNLKILQAGVPDDQHPPLYYLLMYAWVRVDDREFWLRLPSALAGAAAIPLMLGTGSILGGRRFGVITAAFAAASPLLVWYAREMRMYGLATLLWSMALFFYVVLLTRGRWWAAIGLALSNLLGLFTAYPTIGLIGLQVVFALPLWLWRGRGERSRLVSLTAALVATCLGFVPWIPYFQQQLGRESYRFNWPLPWSPSGAIEANLGQTLAVATALGVACAIAFWLLFAGMWRNRRLQAKLKAWRRPLALLGVLLFAVVFLLGAVPRGLTVRRQLLVFWPIVIVFGAWAVNALEWRSAGLVLCLMGVFASGWIVLGDSYEDWRGAIAHVQRHAEPDDPVFFGPIWSSLSAGYYDRDQQTIKLARGHPEEARPSLSPGSTLWYVVNRHPLLRSEIEEDELWLRENGLLIGEALFARYIAVQEYEVK